MIPRPPSWWIWAGAAALVVLVVGLVALSLPGGPVLRPDPVSNPGGGVEAPRLTPPPRYDWTDE